MLLNMLAHKIHTRKLCTNEEDTRLMQRETVFMVVVSS